MYFEYPLAWVTSGAKAEGESMLQYTHRACRHALITKQHGMSSHASAEYFWNEDGRPYYKVDNAAVELFRKINIDVPFKYVVTPFKQFLIRFTESNPICTKLGPVRSMLAMSLTPEQAKDELKGRKDSALVAKSKSVIKEGFFALFVDVGERLPDGRPVLNHILMHRCPEVSVDYSLNNLPHKCDTEVCEAGIERDLLSIVISVCFLATSSDKIIKPDVLSKDLAAYIEAERKQDHERIRVITERAKRRGKIGYFVDGARELVHSPQDRVEGEPTGRELEFRHVRSAHFRKLESGLVTFVRQCVVRKDLPARPSS